MKASEVRPCDICGKPLFHDGSVVCYRVHVEQMVANPAAIREALAMDVMFPGAPRLARTFSDGEVLRPLNEIDRLVCESCFRYGGLWGALSTFPQQEQSIPNPGPG